MRSRAVAIAASVAWTLAACTATASPSVPPITSPTPAPTPQTTPAATSSATPLTPIAWQMLGALDDGEGAAGIEAGAHGMLYIGDNGHSIWHSNDGVAWQHDSLPGKGMQINDIEADGPRAVAVGCFHPCRPNQTGTASSTDGISWNLKALGRSDALMQAVTWTGTEYVAAGAIDFVQEGESECGRAAVWRSTDGLHWGAAEPLEGANKCTGVWDVTAVDGRPTVLGYASKGVARWDLAWTRTPGGSWRRSSPVDEYADWEAITADGPDLVAVGLTSGPSCPDESGCAAVELSEDGLSWEAVPDQAPFRGVDLFHVTTVDGFIVALGRPWSVLVSANGREWVRADPPAADERGFLVGVSAFGSAIVAVSGNGVVWIGTLTGAQPSG